MRHTRRTGRPRVFLSFAGNDRVTAKRLHQDLHDRGVDTFVDEQNIAIGDNFVLAIDQRITQSDYFVLLWSHSSVDRPWVEAEWSAAFARELRERRTFFFIVRLDTTPLPTLLAPRRYLDAFDNWDEMVDELVSTWRRDQAVGEPVLPAPHSPTSNHRFTDGPTITLYVRNRALSVAHAVTVPGNSTGHRLETLVHDALALPDIETKFNGTVGIRFYYQLKKSGIAILVDDTPLPEMHIVDGTTIDLEVQVETFGPGKSSPAITYRKGSSTRLSPAITHSLINSAFGHLIPLGAP
jgi:hypothetical protein